MGNHFRIGKHSRQNGVEFPGSPGFLCLWQGGSNCFPYKPHQNHLKTLHLHSVHQHAPLLGSIYLLLSLWPLNRKIEHFTHSDVSHCRFSSFRGNKRYGFHRVLTTTRNMIMTANSTMVIKDNHHRIILEDNGEGKKNFQCQGWWQQIIARLNLTR